MVRLQDVSLEPPEGLFELLSEVGDGEDGFVGELDYVQGRLSQDALLRQLVDMAAGRNLPDGWVPMTTFWLIDGSSSVVGISRVRHVLNDFLRVHGGNIGYYVARDHRGKGYGRQILALTLPEAKRIGIDRVLLTVDSDNEGSIRVIERNGGVMEDEGIDETTGRLHRRYWIELKGS